MKLRLFGTMCMLLVSMLLPVPALTGAQEALPAGVPKNSEAATIHRVVDGDKVYVRRSNDELDQILLSGIDAPEPGECFHNDSKDFLSDLLPKGTEIFLEQSGSADRDGKFVVRYIWLPGEGEEKALLVNTKMVRDGYAGFDGRRASPKYFENIQKAQDQAKENNRGLWSACGSLHVEESPFTPEELEYIAWLQSETDFSQGALNKAVELTTDMTGLEFFDETWRLQMAAVIATWDISYNTAVAKTPPPAFERLHQLWIDTTWHFDQCGQHLATGIDNLDPASIMLAVDEMELATMSMEEATEELNRINEERGA